MRATLSTIKIAEYKKKGKLFLPLNVPQFVPNDTRAHSDLILESHNKINEIIAFLNDRYTH